MKEIGIAPAESAAEVEAALALAWTAFRDRTATTLGRSYKEGLWYGDPAYASENVIVARKGAGEIAGVVRIVPRTLRRAEQEYNLAGISSVCVGEKYRGAGLSDRMLKCALDIARERGHELSFLFARKAVDHYYLRYGFHGIASYSCLRVEVPHERASRTRISLGRANWSDPAIYALAYEQSYDRCFGQFERSPAYWNYLREKISRMQGIQMLEIGCAGQVRGYALIGEKVVHEIALDKDCDVEIALSTISALGTLFGATPLTQDRVEIEISRQHRLSALLRNIDTTSLMRECQYGGHMGKILAPRQMLDKLACRVGTRLASIGASPLRKDWGRVHLCWDGIRCTADLDDVDGDLSAMETCQLLGASMNTSEGCFLDPPLPLNISLPDRF